MNTINISGWRACAFGFERRALLLLAVVFATAAPVRAQTGTFPITDGAGAGNTVIVVGGVVVGPGLTNGNLAVPHAPTCVGPEYHFHGQLNGVADPAPLGCGWGHVNYTALVPPASVTAPTMVSAPALPVQAARRQASSRQSVTTVAEPQPEFTPGSAGEVLALKNNGSVAPTGRLVAATSTLRKTFADFAALDAQHAMKQTPRPVSREVAREAVAAEPPRTRRTSLWHFSLTGPKAKLSPNSAPSSP